MDLIVNCYLERRGDEWEAICTDLDLAARGTSFNEARDSLFKAIHEYLDYVKGLPKEEQEKFLYRRAPLFTRLGFALGAFLTAISSGRDHNRHRRNVYTFPCAA